MESASERARDEENVPDFITQPVGMRPDQLDDLHEMSLAQAVARPVANSASAPQTVMSQGTPDSYHKIRSIEPSIDDTPPPSSRLINPRLVVVRGQIMNQRYPILDGKNFIGRSAENPVDIDLDGQEPSERIWASRQHAVISYENQALILEDLASLNGTFLNRSRINAGEQYILGEGDIIQIGTVQLRVHFS